MDVSSKLPLCVLKLCAISSEADILPTNYTWLHSSFTMLPNTLFWSKIYEVSQLHNQTNFLWSNGQHWRVGACWIM